MPGSIAPDLNVFMNYEYDADPNGDNALAYILQLTGVNKRILEIGAGAGVVTRHLVKSKGCEVVALEINPAAIEKLKAYVDRVYAVDLNGSDWIAKLGGEEKFDVIVAADVLEHVYDPWTVLKQAKSLLNENGKVILSLPHAAHCAMLSSLFGEDFRYAEWGLLDKTHVRFFGLHNIHALYASAGLAITEARFVMRRPEETEFAEQWAQLPKRLQTAFSSSRYGYIYQVVTGAMLAENVSRPVDLFDVVAPIPAPATFFQKMKSAVGL
jgi:2-polyprenyl-3-methyl-5-hydroxy-6-metoxy-1,4-benzoquinol methylase